jgi:hypothetical protein
MEREAASLTVTLERRLTTLSATLFGLSYICPTVVVSTFGLAWRTRAFRVPLHSAGAEDSV